MKFDTRTEDYTKGKLERFLESRNVLNTELFLNPEMYEKEEEFFGFKNMVEAVRLFLAHYNIENKIGVLVDSDADGFTSAAKTYRYINELPKSNITHFLHEGKQHGLENETFEKIINSDIDLLIIPDAASNDIRELFLLKHSNIDVIVLDHHEIEEENYFEEVEGLYVVNTKSKFNPDTNKELTGVGMVYLFLKAIDYALNINAADNQIDLVAIGQISDSSDITNPYIRKKVFQGLSNITNELVQTILEKENVNFDNLIPRDVSFKISPLINAVCRVGKPEERELLFLTLAGVDLDVLETVTKKKKNRETGKFEKYEITLSKTEICFDMLKKVKARQQKMVKDTLTFLQNTSDYMESDYIGIFKLQDSSVSAITGLVAMKLAEQKQKPCLVIHNVGDSWFGSGRGYESKIESLREWCNEKELFEYVQGHDNAFGLEIKSEKLEELLVLNSNAELSLEAPTLLVDVLQRSEVDKEEVNFFVENMSIFGGVVTEAVIGFENIKVPKRFINIKGSMITFFAGGMEFVSYNTPREKIDALTLGFTMDYFIDFIGSPSIASFGQNIGNAQIVLRDFEILEGDKMVGVVKNEAVAVQEKYSVENIVF